MNIRHLIRVSVIVLAAMATVGPVSAQVDFRQVERDARDAALEGRTPFAGLSEVGTLSRVWSVNTFYVVYRGDYRNQTVFWAIRRETGGREGLAAIVWADSRSCPAVETVLRAMERLPAVRPDAIRLGEESANMGLVLDGTQHNFWNRWARSGPDDATVSLEIGGNVNSPIAHWWATAVQQLAQCWTNDPPA
jgi:hypothetical protein